MTSESILENIYTGDTKVWSGSIWFPRQPIFLETSLDTIVKWTLKFQAVLGSEGLRCFENTEFQSYWA